MKSKFMLLLTTSLALTAPPTSIQNQALDTWADTYLPMLTNQARVLISPPFAWSEIGALAENAVQAGQALKGVFKGVDRAGIAQAVFGVAVRTAIDGLPSALQEAARWVLPLIEGDPAKHLIESAFQKLFGSPDAGPAPVVDALEVVPGGIQ